MYGSKLYYKHTHPCNSEREDGGGVGGLDKLWSKYKSGDKLSNGAKIGEWLACYIEKGGFRAFKT